MTRGEHTVEHGQARPVVTIDGTNAVGKGTLGRSLAAYLGWPYLDTGLMYRAAGVAVAEIGIEVDDPEASAAAVTRIRFEIARPDVLMTDGARPDIDTLRSHEAGDLASRISVHKLVRSHLQDVQRTFAEAGNVILDGRDMGTVVAPDARYKLFLTARPKVRAERRVAELKSKGVQANPAKVLDDVVRRDERDSTRTADPLRPAENALVIDTSDLVPGEVFRRVLGYYKL